VFAVFEKIMEVFFIIDIFFSFNTGYYKRGELIMNRRRANMHYLKTWFLLDLFASFPYEDLINLNGLTDELENYRQLTRLARIIKIFRFIRILKLLRVLKL